MEVSVNTKGKMNTKTSSSTINVREFKKQVREFVIPVDMLPTKDKDRYDIWSDSKNKTVELRLEHCSKGTHDIIISKCDVDTFRKKLSKLFKTTIKTTTKHQ